MAFQFVTRAVAPPLSAYVESLWCAIGRVPCRRERLLPNGRPVMIINLGTPFRTVLGDGAPRMDPAGWLTGLSDRAMLNEPFAEFQVFGITFQPWGCAALLGIAAHELANRSVAAADAWGPDFAALRDDLGEAASPGIGLRLLEEALCRRIHTRPAPERRVLAAARAICRPDATGVTEAARTAGLSGKHLTALFRDHVGLTP